MPKFDVMGLGIAACDYVTRTDTFPARDQKVRSEDFEIQGGGTVGTALVTMQRLGLRTAYAGCLGEDDFGRFILKGLESEDIDTTMVQVVAGARSPFAFCVSTPPSRNVFSIRPTTPPYSYRSSDLDKLLDTRYVHLDGTEEEASLELAREAKARGIGVSLDFQRVRPTTEGLLAYAEIAVVAEGFAKQRYPGRDPIEAVEELYRPDMLIAAVTLGERGVVAKAGDAVFEVPAEPVDVIDSTGAGDVFHGALLVSILSGHTARRALETASHVAALSCRQLGGRAGIPSRDELGGDWL